MSDEQARTVGDFLAATQFMRRGAVMTDLDGTALQEEGGRIFVSQAMQTGLAHMASIGRPVILNTLRFPLSVIRTFGEDWAAHAGTPIPLVSLRGSLCGELIHDDEGRLAFEEFDARCLSAPEIDALLAFVRGLPAALLEHLRVFFYPRDWRRGEIIWVRDADQVAPVARKYASAEHVFAGDATALEIALRSAPVCMAFRLLDAPQDHAMAYQHTERTSFHTAAGVDKRAGALRIAGHLGVDLDHSIAAGDSPMDDFLDVAGLSVIVGRSDLPFRGRRATLHVPDAAALGLLLQSVAQLGQKLDLDP